MLGSETARRAIFRVLVFVLSSVSSPLNCRKRLCHEPRLTFQVRIQLQLSDVPTAPSLYIEHAPFFLLLFFLVLVLPLPPWDYWSEEDVQVLFGFYTKRSIASVAADSSAFYWQRVRIERRLLSFSNPRSRTPSVFWAASDRPVLQVMRRAGERFESSDHSLYATKIRTRIQMSGKCYTLRFSPKGRIRPVRPSSFGYSPGSVRLFIIVFFFGVVTE